VNEEGTQKMQLMIRMLVRRIDLCEEIKNSWKIINLPSGNSSINPRFLTSGEIDKYLKKILIFLKQSFSEDVASVILFGSQVARQGKKVSDLDLLIIMKDTATPETMRKIASNLRWLELATGLMKPAKGTGRILQAIEIKTGMFVCHFLCRRQDFLAWRFAKVFGVNSFLAKLLAPGDLVRLGILSNGITLAGEDLLSKLSYRRIKTSQLAKSCLMNLLQAMGSLLIAPVSSRTTIYSMEAVKWSLFSSYTYITGKGAFIQEITHYFKNRLLNRPFLSSQLSHFIQLREDFRPSARFSIKAPLTVFLIYKMAIRKLKSSSS
jgi:predicted nucleotidyltransferase